MNRLFDTGCLRCMTTGHVDGLGGDRPIAICRRKQPLTGTFGLPILTQQRQEFFRKQSLAVAVTFSLTYPQHMATSIDVTGFELGHLGHANSAPIEHGQNRAVPKFRGSLEYRLDFLPAENQRQLSLAPGEWNALDLDF